MGDIEKHIEDLMVDLVADLLYYDRKGDGELPPGAIEAMIARGDLSEGQLGACFLWALHRGIAEGR